MLQFCAAVKATALVHRAMVCGPRSGPEAGPRLTAAVTPLTAAVGATNTGARAYEATPAPPAAPPGPPPGGACDGERFSRLRQAQTDGQTHRQTEGQTNKHVSNGTRSSNVCPVSKSATPKQGSHSDPKNRTDSGVILSPRPCGATIARCTANARRAQQRLAAALSALPFAVAAALALGLALGALAVGLRALRRLLACSGGGGANDAQTTAADTREPYNGNCGATGGDRRGWEKPA